MCNPPGSFCNAGDLRFSHLCIVLEDIDTSPDGLEMTVQANCDWNSIKPRLKEKLMRYPDGVLELDDLRMERLVVHLQSRLGLSKEKVRSLLREL